MAQLALVDAYEAFMQTAHRYVKLSNDADYKATLAALEDILESAEDTVDDPMNPLIELLAQSIEVYESQDKELITFIEDAGSIPSDIALLQTLMKQHGLTGSDFPEIGDKTMVSKVLNGKRILQRRAMEQLGQRFGIRPALFLGG
jgi:HTH-type transcriptional regulator / antitoxin HigA